MNYSKLSYKEMLFLYAFLRQMDLSLDRSRWTSVEELQNYYLDRISPEQMINYLNLKLNLSSEDLNHLTEPTEMSFKDKLKLFFNKNLLTKKEATDLYHLLLLFDQHLKSGSKEYTVETEGLRMDIGRFYSRVLKPRISRRSVKRLMKIEHYEQNRLIKTTELKKVVPKDFFKL